jgi:hypothetical protein
MTKQAASSKKRPIKSGSVCLQCRRTFNDQSSLKKHRDRGSRACAPRPDGFAHGDAPGMFMSPVTSTYATDICTAPDPALVQEMSLFEAALEAQDTESADNCKPEQEPPSGHSVTAAGDDDVAAGHNSTATIGAAVPAYRFMAWLDGEPGLLAKEDRFFLRGDVEDVEDVVEHDEDNMSFQSGGSNSREHFNFVPLPTSGLPVEVQDIAPEYIHHYQAAKFKDIKVDATLHDAQKELMHYIKNTVFLQVYLMMFTNGRRSGSNWATSSSRQSQKQ